MKEINIVLLEHTAPHYRRDLFNLLQNNSQFRFHIIAGNDYEGIKCITENIVLLTYKKIQFISHKFYYLKKSIKSIKSINPDIIICSGYDPHMIHSSIIFLINKLFWKKKFIWWSHVSTGQQGYFGYLLRKIIYKSSNGILAYSTDGKNRLLKMGIKNSKIEVIGNSVNMDEYGFKLFPGLKKQNTDIIKLLFCGRLTPNKKVDILIHAIKELTKKNSSVIIKCCIIGDGPSLINLKKLTNDLGLGGIIEFVGAKYESEIFPFFLDSNIFVYPGGIGLSLIHALSFGLPTITTNNMLLHGPEIELLKPGINGDFYEDNSIEDFADKILFWGKKLVDNHSNIVLDCYKPIIENKYLPEEMNDKLIQILKKIYIN